MNRLARLRRVHGQTRVPVRDKTTWPTAATASVQAAECILRLEKGRAEDDAATGHTRLGW